MYDDELIGKGINAGLSYAIRGRRLYGSDVAPAVAHIGYKMAQVGRYGQLAYAGYKLGKKFVNSFSQNEKTMPPKRSRSTSTPTPKGGPTQRRIAARILAAMQKSPRAIRVAKPSPGFFKRSGKRKSYSRSGASSSKSAGKFNKARGREGIMDKFVKKGVVLASERGGVMSTTAVEQAQSFIIGHVTAGSDHVRSMCAYGLVKMIAQKLGRAVLDFNQLALPGGGRIENLGIQYYTAGNGKASFSADFTSTSTWQDIYSQVLGFFNNHNTDVSFYMTVLEWQYKSVATTPAVGTQTQFRLDLVKARVQMYTKSSLKVQNRTINTAGNDEEGDVDNVPMYGKQYEGNGNHIVYGNHLAGALYPSNDILRCNADLLIQEKATNAALPQLREPPPLSVLKNAKTIAKAKLDPGEVKTSVLTWSQSALLNVVLRKTTISNNLSPLVTPQHIGKFRIFILEKMIQAVATDNINGMKLAYELDAKYAVICTAPKETTTTMVININPV